MNLQRKIGASILIAFIVLLGFLQIDKPVQASSNGLPFVVEPILPSNQDKQVSSYISINPDETELSQELQFKVTNKSNEEQEVKVNVVNAYTSPNGVIQYVKEETDNSKIVDENYELVNYLTYEAETVKIAEGETKTITTILDVMDVEGTILGGVSFSAVEEGEKREEGESSFQINNEINMIIGVKVDFETDQEAEFSVGDPYVDPMPAYFAVRLPTTLTAPLLQQGVELNYAVTLKGKELFANKKDFSFSPKTETNIAIPFEFDEIEENTTYVIKGEFVYTDRHEEEQVYEFEREFQYEKEKSENTVGEMLRTPLEKESYPLWIAFLLLIILVVAIYIYFKKKKEKEQARQKELELKAKQEELAKQEDSQDK